MIISQYFQAFKNVIFPNICFSCGQKMNASIYLCPNCREKISYIYPPCCILCATPLEFKKISICHNCYNKKTFYNQLICSVQYTEPLASLLQLFKYKDHDYLGKLFSDILINYILKVKLELSAYDFILPVPISKEKLKDRGFNQSSLMATNLANYFNIPLINDIIYAKEIGISQVKSNRNERIKNIQNKFFTSNTYSNLDNKSIILFDDIFTTGATINACAKLLKEKGAKNILALTLAKTM